MHKSIYGIIEIKEIKINTLGKIMKIELKLVCDQLTKLLNLSGTYKVSAVIDEEYDNEFLGWCLIREAEDGTKIPQLGTRVATIKELYDNFHE